MKAQLLPAPRGPGETRMIDDFLLAIPVYNEAPNLERVLDQARQYCRSILVIDDGSTDETPQLLQAHRDIRIVTHPANRGYGQSLSEAFSFAQAHDYSWLVTMDADEQHEASYIPEFMAEAARDRADVISGTRYPAGHQRPSSAPADRRRINAHITAILNERLGLGITDAFCGFKAYRVATLGHFRVTVPGYAMPIQWWVQVARARLQVVELPVRLIYHSTKRCFGGVLDDPAVRLAHYLDVFEHELAHPRTPALSTETVGCSPSCTLS